MKESQIEVKRQWFVSRAGTWIVGHPFFFWRESKQLGGREEGGEEQDQQALWKASQGASMVWHSEGKYWLCWSLRGEPISVFLVRGTFWSCKLRKQEGATTLWTTDFLFSDNAISGLPFWNIHILKFQIFDWGPILPFHISEKGSLVFIESRNGRFWLTFQIMMLRFNLTHTWLGGLSRVSDF